MQAGMLGRWVWWRRGKEGGGGGCVGKRRDNEEERERRFVRGLLKRGEDGLWLIGGLR